MTCLMMTMTNLTAPQISIKKTIGGGYNRFWNSRDFYRVVKGSRGSKKSKTTALWYIHHIMKYEWANLLVVRRFSNALQQSVFTDMKWAASKLKVSHLFKFTKSPLEITYLPTGQKILFRGLDDPLKITSITVEVGVLSWAWFEEAYQIESAAAFDTVVESIRGGHDDPDFFKQITVTFNPWNEKHWLKSTFFDPSTRRKNVFAITTTYRDNEWLDEIDISRNEDLYRTNPRRARIVNDGHWGVAEGLVFESIKIDNFNISQVIRDTGRTVHGMDFGFTHDPTTLISAAVDLDHKKLYIYSELYEHGLITSQIADEVRKLKLHKAKIMADGAEPRLIAELKESYALNISGAPKPKGSIIQGIDFIKGFEIVVHPSCEHTIEEFETYAFKQDKLSGKYTNVPVDDNNHLIDALRYALTPYHIKSKPKQDKRKKTQMLKQFGL